MLCYRSNDVEPLVKSCYLLWVAAIVILLPCKRFSRGRLKVVMTLPILLGKAGRATWGRWAAVTSIRSGLRNSAFLPLLLPAASSPSSAFGRNFAIPLKIRSRNADSLRRPGKRLVWKGRPPCRFGTDPVEHDCPTTPTYNLLLMTKVEGAPCHSASIQICPH
jgi:hypothetical protein